MRHNLNTCNHPNTPAGRAACRRRGLPFYVTFVTTDGPATRSFPTVDLAIEWAEANVAHAGNVVPNALSHTDFADDTDRTQDRYEHGIFDDARATNLMGIVVRKGIKI